jgi:hypothetical protein
MDEAAEKLLKHFAEACPTASLSSDDWRRLYRFTLDIHRRRLHTHHRTVRDYLLTHGCSPQKASWLSAQYHHFMELLALYDRQMTS